MTAVQVRVGIPVTGGQLVRAARERSYPVLFSANAFARTHGPGHDREGCFNTFRAPDPAQFAGLDAALDSAGFVAASKYGDFRWSVDEYLDLVASHSWSWWASMDYCCEPAIASDRPMRLLRIAATASMLWRCREGARRRGLQMPMPVLQGWTPDEYELCAEWLGLTEWPDLVGIGSVCCRSVNGPDGILAIVEAVDRFLPSHVRLHLFGVKSAALALLTGHPRLASVDSMAWDVQARSERRTGRDMAFRIGHMESWASKQRQHAAASASKVGLQASLPLGDAGGGCMVERYLQEAIALQYADLIMDGNLDYRDAVHHAHVDCVVLVAVLRNYRMSATSLQEFDSRLGGVAARLVEIASHLPAVRAAGIELQLIDDQQLEESHGRPSDLSR